MIRFFCFFYVFYLKKLFNMQIASDYIIYIDNVGNLCFLYNESYYFGATVIKFIN